jgi:BioD-like phosphotransacetylase family protein
MKCLYLTGRPGSGKTAICLGMAFRMRDEGLRVSYFKPFGRLKGMSTKDIDMLLMKEVLQLPHPPEIISPVCISPLHLSVDMEGTSGKMLDKIKTAFREVSEESDIVLVDGSFAPYINSSRHLNDFLLAKELGASILHIINIIDDFSFDEDLFYNDHARLLGLHILGNIFNNTGRTIWDKTKGVYKPILEEHGYQVLGIIPRRPEIAAPTVAEFYEVLGGELLTGEINMDRLIEDVVVGTMTIESALGYLRRSPNKAVITGGDRDDMALTALETNTSVIILTGGLYPNVKVIARAKEKGVPVILVHTDTFTTLENLHVIHRTIHPDDSKAIAMVKENVCRYCECEQIIEFVRN